MRKLSALLLSLTVSLALAGCSGNTNNTNETLDMATTENLESEESVTKENIQPPETEESTKMETTKIVTEPTVESTMLSFVDSFNSNCTISLVFAEDFTPSDKSSSHYRTEFRLGAFSDAIGKSYTYEETVVDLVGKQSYFGDISIRVYMNGASLEQCIEMLKYASPIMDPDIDSTELQEAIDYVTENKTANGYYYADLGLLLLGNDSKGYEFMLKMGND